MLRFLRLLLLLCLALLHYFLFFVFFLLTFLHQLLFLIPFVLLFLAPFFLPFLPSPPLSSPLPYYFFCSFPPPTSSPFPSFTLSLSPPLHYHLLCIFLLVYLIPVFQSHPFTSLFSMANFPTSSSITCSPILVFFVSLLIFPSQRLFPTPWPLLFLTFILPPLAILFSSFSSSPLQQSYPHIPISTNPTPPLPPTFCFFFPHTLHLSISLF